MAKSTSLNFTQNLNTTAAMFASSDLLSVIAAAPNSNGTTISVSGTIAFTAALGSGTKISGGTDATWTALVSDGRVISPATITGYGTYLTSPSDVTTNAATISGTSNATWALTVGVLKTLYTGGENDSVVKAINVASFDSAARIMTLWISNAATGGDTFFGAVNIPATAGTGSGTTAAIDLLGGTLLPSLPYDANGKRIIPLKAGQVLKASVPGVTAAKLIVAQVIAEDY